MEEEEIEKERERRNRINRLIETEGLSQRAFAEKIGYSYSSLNKIMTGIRKVPNSLPSKIVEEFKGVRLEWLLYGTGAMYAKDQHLVDKTAINEHMAMLPTRPRLPKDISEGPVEEYYKGPKRSLCQERPIIYNLPDYDFSLILKNKRMEPKYEKGDEVFFKRTNYIQNDMDPLWGEEYLLDTEDGLMFKRIYPAKDKKGEECFRCVAYNREEFPDFLVPRKTVYCIYKCVGALKFK